MITFEDLSNLLNGTSVDFDNYYGPQCVDLVQFWSRNLGGPRFTGDAQDIFNQAGSFYTQVVNTPDGVPQKGDIVVWSSTFNGTVGHVGISTGKGDTNTFEVFEQNDPGPGVCLFKTYDYNSVLGWLHPASIPQDQQTTIDQLRTERDTNWNLYVGSQQDLQKCRRDLSVCLSSTQSYQVPEVVSPPVDQNSTEPVVPTSTQTVEVPITHSGQETPPLQVNQPVEKPPFKPLMRLSDLIVWIRLNILNTLKNIVSNTWVFIVGR